MERQKTLFINAMNCQDLETINNIVKHLLNLDGELCPHTETVETKSHLWNADTKYYTAGIDLTVVTAKSIMTKKFSESVEAVLLHFDSRKDLNGLEKMKSWLTFVNMWEPSIKLAVCERCSSEGDDNTLSRVTVQEWCLDHEFELIELNPDPEDYDEFEDTGLKRIKSALLAHIWPSMDMKNPQNAVKKVPIPCGIAASESTTASAGSAQLGIDSLLGLENEFDDVVGNENEQDDFEKLFSKLSVMKNQASSMRPEDRKKYAENMVRAFWTALGGDEEEFEGLSSDEGEPSHSKT